MLGLLTGVAVSVALASGVRTLLFSRGRSKKGGEQAVPAAAEPARTEGGAEADVQPAQAYAPALHEDPKFHVSLGSLGFALAGVFVPPLQLVSVGGMTWLSIPIWKDAYQSIFHDRKVRMCIADAILLPSIIASGYLVAGSLGYIVIVSGRNLLRRTYSESRQSLLDLYDVPAHGLRRLREDGTIESAELVELDGGDRIVLLPGDVVPVDGTILEGFARLDQRALTGESQPVERMPGEPVLATTLLVEGRLVVRVDRAGRETTAGRVSQILAETIDFKSGVELRSERFGNSVTLPLIGTAGLTWIAVGGSSATAVLAAPIVATIRLAAPVSVLNHIHRASKQGVLVRDGRSLELLAGVDTFVFDKTGTLTTDKLTVTGIEVIAGWDAERVLELAASIEREQPHPIAHAIVDAAHQRGISLRDIEDTNLSLGAGVEARVDGHRVRLGSARFLESSLDRALPATLGATTLAETDVATRVYVAVDGVCVGAIALTPSLRPDTEATIGHLQRRGYDVLILSGDQERPTRNLANRLGIKRYYAETLPGSKAEVIRELQAEGRCVCFVGDGINDAIALKQAQVSVSLNDATQLASETAQVVLMHDHLDQLLGLLEIAENLDRDMNKIILSGAIPSVLCIGGAVVGLVGLAGASVFFCGSMLSGLAIAHASQPTSPKERGSSVAHRWLSQKGRGVAQPVAEALADGELSGHPAPSPA